MLNWQIGKKYRRRNGAISTMKSFLKDYRDSKYGRIVEFVEGSNCWENNGRLVYDNECPLDIIEEVNEMKIEVGKYYKTRDGLKVRIIEEIESARGRTHLGIIHTKDDTRNNSARTLQYYNADGTIYNLNEHNHRDLIEEWKEPKSGVVYINIYEGHDPNQDTQSKYRGHWPNRIKADTIAEDTGEKRLACVRIEWKEGQFDD